MRKQTKSVSDKGSEKQKALGVLKACSLGYEYQAKILAMKKKKSEK